MKYGAFLNSIKNPNYYYINYDYLKMIIKNNDKIFLCELDSAISIFDKKYNINEISHYNIETITTIYKILVINYLSINKLIKKYIKYNNSYSNINMNELLSKYTFYQFLVSPSIKNTSKNVCPICLDFCNFPITTTCNHTFCCSCLIKTSYNLNSCPYCRNDTIINPITSIIKELIPNDDYKQYQPYNSFSNSLFVEKKFNCTSYDIVSDLHIDQWSHKYNIKHPCGKVVESPYYFSKFLVFKKRHLWPLAVISAFVVQLLSKLTDRKLEIILFQNDFISIDYWFFIHVLNTNLVVLAYKESISCFWFMFCVLGWEVLENGIIPNLHPSVAYYRETIPNTIGDIVAAIPAFLLLKQIKY